MTSKDDPLQAVLLEAEEDEKKTSMEDSGGGEDGESSLGGNSTNAEEDGDENAAENSDEEDDGHNATDAAEHDRGEQKESKDQSGDEDDNDSDSSGSSSESDDDENGGMSAYERLRLENVRRNNERLKQLGLAGKDGGGVLGKKKPHQKRRRVSTGGDSAPSRRSRRSAGTTVSYVEPSLRQVMKSDQNQKPDSQESAPADDVASQPRRGRLQKEEKAQKMARFVYDEFHRIRQHKKLMLKEAEKNKRSAEIEVKYWQKKAAVKEKKVQKAMEAERIAKQQEEELATYGTTLQKYVHTLDRRMNETNLKIRMYDASILKAEQRVEAEARFLENQNRVRLLDALDAYPKSMKEATRSLSSMLLDRAPKDPPPARRSKRQSEEGTTGGGEPRKKKSKADDDEGKPPAEHESFSEAAALPAAAAQASLQTKAESPLKGAEEGRTKRQKRELNVGGWVAPSFGPLIDRAWLQKDSGHSQFQPNTYNPQPGDTVLYYIAGHRDFLMKFPDHLENKKISRAPLWERAIKERKKAAKSQNKGQDQENDSASKTWWDDTWISEVEGNLAFYPLVCKVERTQAEFPPDPTPKVNGTWVLPEANQQTKRKKKTALRLAVSLRPLTTVFPPAWTESGPVDKHNLALPPSFTVVTFPSKLPPFIIPFAWAYVYNHSLALNDGVLINQSKVPDKAKIRSFETLASTEEDFGSFRLEDKLDVVANILGPLKNGDFSKQLSEEAKGKVPIAPTIPPQDALVICQFLARMLSVNGAALNNRIDNNDQRDSDLVNLIRSSLPLWKGVSVVRDLSDRKTYLASVWDVKSPTTRPKNDAVSSQNDFMEFGFATRTLDNVLGQKIERTIEDFLRETPAAAPFNPLVTNEIAPGYTQAIPIAMSFSRILQRLKQRKGPKGAPKAFYYRSFAAVMQDVSAIQDNCCLYNAVDSEIVASANEIIPAAKKTLSSVFSSHTRERKEKLKKKDEKKRFLAAASSSDPSPIAASETQQAQSQSPNPSEEPFKGPLYRDWVQLTVPDVLSKHNEQKLQENRFPQWVPQTGDSILYSRKMQEQFVEGHRESLFTNHCLIPQLKQVDDSIKEREEKDREDKRKSKSGADKTNVSSRSANPKRRRRCGTCENCKKEDCGVCTNCADMKKFGGEGSKRQACVQRRCLTPFVPNEKKRHGDASEAAQDETSKESPIENQSNDKSGGNKSLDSQLKYVDDEATKEVGEASKDIASEDVAVPTLTWVNGKWVAKESTHQKEQTAKGAEVDDSTKEQEETSKENASEDKPDNKSGGDGSRDSELKHVDTELGKTPKENPSEDKVDNKSGAGESSDGQVVEGTKEQEEKTGGGKPDNKSGDDESPDEPEPEWRVGIILGIRAEFPRTRKPHSKSTYSEGAFETDTPFLAIEIKFPGFETAEVFWRPCCMVSRDVQNKSELSTGCCKTCGVRLATSFLCPSWANQFGGDLPTDIIVPPNREGKRPEAPLGISKEEALAFEVHLSLLKRRCMNGVPPDQLDPQLTAERVKHGYLPQMIRVAHNTLPSFEEWIAVEPTESSKTMTTRGGRTQEPHPSMYELAAVNFLPPWLPQTVDGKNAKSDVRRLMNSISPWPKLCLELVLIRIRNGYYRSRLQVNKDIKDAFVTSVLLLLAQVAKRKKNPLSIRKLAGVLNTRKYTALTSGSTQGNNSMNGTDNSKVPNSPGGMAPTDSKKGKKSKDSVENSRVPNSPRGKAPTDSMKALFSPMKARKQGVGASPKKPPKQGASAKAGKGGNATKNGKGTGSPGRAKKQPALKLKNSSLSEEENIRLSKLEIIRRLYAAALFCTSETTLHFGYLNGLVPMQVSRPLLRHKLITLGPEDHRAAQARKTLVLLVAALGKDMCMNRYPMAPTIFPTMKIKIMVEGKNVEGDEPLPALNSSDSPNDAPSSAGAGAEHSVTSAPLASSNAATLAGAPSQQALVSSTRGAAVTTLAATAQPGVPAEQRVVSSNVTTAGAQSQQTLVSSTGGAAATPLASTVPARVSAEPRVVSFSVTATPEAKSSSSSNVPKCVMYGLKDFEENESLTRAVFGKPGRMFPCLRCQATRRSMLACRVMLAHSNVDFDLTRNFEGVDGGLDGLFRMLLKVPEPPKPAIEQSTEKAKAPDSSEKTDHDEAINNSDKPKDDSPKKHKSSDDEPINGNADAEAEAKGAESQEASQSGGTATNIPAKSGGESKNEARDEVDPRVWHARATSALAQASELLACAKKYEEAPPRLSEDFMSANFPFDPADGKYTFCIICGLSGDLLCCDTEGCPNVLHPKCGNMDEIPEGDWFCNDCVAKKGAETALVGAKDCISSTKEGEGADDIPRAKAEENAGEPLSDAAAPTSQPCLDAGIVPDTAALAKTTEAKEQTKAAVSGDGGIQDSCSQQHEAGENSEEGGFSKSQNESLEALSVCTIPPIVVYDEEKATELTNELEQLFIMRMGRRRGEKSETAANSAEQAGKETKEETPNGDKKKENQKPQGPQLGTKFEKKFGSYGYFAGEVTAMPTEEEPFFRVTYDDGDQEDLTEKEVLQLVAQTKRRKAEAARPKKKRGRPRKNQNPEEPSKNAKTEKGSEKEKDTWTEQNNQENVKEETLKRKQEEEDVKAEEEPAKKKRKDICDPDGQNKPPNHL